MENILTGHPDITAVFASNDNMALGAVQAIKSAGMSGKIIVVGFDANPNAAAGGARRRHGRDGRAEPAQHRRVRR